MQSRNWEVDGYKKKKKKGGEGCYFSPQSSQKPEEAVKTEPERYLRDKPWAGRVADTLRSTSSTNEQKQGN